MHKINFFSLLLILFLASTISAQAQNKVVVVPSDDGYISIPLPSPEPEKPVPNTGYLDAAIGKEMRWTKGWDKNIGNRTKIDPTVVIKYSGIRPTPYGSSNSIYYNAPEIGHWGLQRTFPTSKRIYAKAALFIDRGSFVEGGFFEWSLNRQGFMSLYNIYITDYSKYPQAWIREWTPPRSGDKVWFFLMSDDERFSSNPFTFTWP